MRSYYLTALQRFWMKVKQGDTCWEWVGAKQPSGYGNFWFEGRTWKAHRWAYVHFVGRVPDDLDLDHLCRNRSCVNPFHLEPVTRRENSMRGESPTIIAHRTNTCANGHVDDWILAPKGRRCRKCVRAYMKEYLSRPEVRARRADQRRAAREKRK